MLKNEFFKEIKDFVKVDLKENNKDKIYEGFDVELVSEPLYEEFMQMF